MNFLRLSKYVQPRMMMGSVPITPQNMSSGEDRIEYLEGLIDYCKTLIQMTERQNLPAEVVYKQIQTIPMAGHLVHVLSKDGRLTVLEREGVRNCLTCDENKLTMLFKDGRRRAISDSLSLPTGKATANFSAVIGALAKGTTLETLRKLGNDAKMGSLPEDLVARLVDLDMIDRLEAAASPPLRWTGTGPRLTWLGHASLLFQDRNASILVDPLLYPKIVWGPDDVVSLFSSTFADPAFFSPYGPEAQPLSASDLPELDAVCITHQDSDHFDLGTLMMVPETIPIVVPISTGQKWSVDLVKTIRSFLGEARNVVPLRHGESLQVKDLTITAFAFRGEMPTCLPHQWNCYSLETDSVVVACTADATFGRPEVDFLLSRMSGNQRRLTVCTGYAPASAHKISPGYREGLNPNIFYNASRLWPWYLPIGQLFVKTPMDTITLDSLELLNETGRFDYLFPYAKGSTPWHRINNPIDSFATQIASLTDAQWKEAGKRIAHLQGLRIFPAKYGIPVALA